MKDASFKETIVPGPLSPKKTVCRSLMNMMKSEDLTIKFEDQYETRPGLIVIIIQLNYPGELEEIEGSLLDLRNTSQTFTFLGTKIILLKDVSPTKKIMD